MIAPARSDTISVLIVDDHDIVLRGLQVSLDTFSDIDVIGHAHTGTEAIARTKQLNPDVLLLDLMMPDMNGLAVIEQLQEMPSMPIVVVLTNFKEANLVQGALESGATSYLLKNVSVTELGQAIRNAVCGKTTLAPEAAKVLINRVTQPKASDFELTAREYDVLAELTQGLSNKQISEKLFISHSTVKNHVSAIITKLGVKSRTQAATKALRLNLLSNEL